MDSRMPRASRPFTVTLATTRSPTAVRGTKTTSPSLRATPSPPAAIDSISSVSRSVIGRGAIPAWQPSLEPLDVDRAGAELVVLHHAQVEIARGLDAVDRELEQRAVHALDRLRARRAPDDELREHRIVVQADLAARLDAAVPAHAGPARHVQILDAPRGRQESVRRILARDAALDRPAARLDVRCGNGSFSPAAMRSCHCTRSIPVTSSVTGCSTWMRVFISRK